MPLHPLAIFGAGGHAKEVAELVRDLNAVSPQWDLRGLLADAGAKAFYPATLPILGDAQWLAQHPETWVVVAVGDPAKRRAIVQRLQAQVPGVRFATLVHPRAWVASSVQLGEGALVFAGCLLNVDVTVGVHASLNLGCSISHDCELGDFVSLGPGVHLAGGACVGSGSDLGVGVSVRPMTRVGQDCVVGAGAAVVKDLPSGCTAVGVPARPSQDVAGPT